MIARAWGAFLLAFGALLLALMCFAWAIASVLLLPLASARWGRRVGRMGAMCVFRGWLGVMEALGERYFARELAAAGAPQVSEMPNVESATHIRG